MQKSKIAIRADGGQQIGLGHLIRCIALAHMLKRNFEIFFYCKEIPDEILIEINSEGFNFYRLEHEEDFFEHISNNSITVLDGYSFNTDFQIKVKSTGSKLVCIDDLHKIEFVADLIINHSPGISPLEYKTQPYTQFALGLEYSLLRPVFLDQAKKKRIIREIKNVFICFGGSDPGNYTRKVLHTIIDYSYFRKIIVVIGPAYHDIESIESLIHSDFRIDLRQSLTSHKMLMVMKEAELAIVPSSGILYEAFAAGCKVISGKVMDNQIFFYENLKKEGLFIDAGDFSDAKLKNAMSEVSTSPKGHEKVIDGFAGSRILNLFDRLRNETHLI